MRTISELLTILRDNVMVEYDEICDGLCYEAAKLYENKFISLDEKFELCEYIEKNMPHYIYINTLGIMVKNIYGWNRGEWPPRLKWLNEHIELNKEKLK